MSVSWKGCLYLLYHNYFISVTDINTVWYYFFLILIPIKKFQIYSQVQLKSSMSTVKSQFKCL